MLEVVLYAETLESTHCALLCMEALAVLEVMRCALLCLLAAVEGRLCMPEVMHCVLLCLLDWEGVAIENNSGAWDDAAHGHAGDWVDRRDSRITAST